MYTGLSNDSTQLSGSPAKNANRIDQRDFVIKPDLSMDKPMRNSPVLKPTVGTNQVGLGATSKKNLNVNASGDGMEGSLRRYKDSPDTRGAMAAQVDVATAGVRIR